MTWLSGNHWHCFGGVIRSLGQLTLIPVTLATGALAEPDSQGEVERLIVSHRSMAADVHANVRASGGMNEEQIPASLRSPLQSLFGQPLAMKAAAAATPVAADTEAEGPESSSQNTNAVKSPGKALFLSALLPGTGEYYAGNRKRAAIFLGLEALGWALWSRWDSKGNDVVDEFRATAREEWDSGIYLNWRLSSRAQNNNSFTHALPCSVFVAEGKAGLAKCPESEVQQYYELIGKYDQFVVGWDDLQHPNGGSATPSAVDSVESVSSAKRLAYERRRDESNEFLERASTMTGLILVNHVLSAIDASLVARDAANGKAAAAIEGRTRFAFTTRDGLRGGAPILLAYKPFY